MPLGFIVLRHVNNAETNRYWQLCYQGIRRYYPESDIIIIDDNSNYDFIDITFQNSLHKTKVVRSMWEGRGELLPYFYYVSYRWFDTAVILHDSVFINKYIDFEEALSNGCGYKFLWEFGVQQDPKLWFQNEDEVKIIRQFINTDNTDNTDNLVDGLLQYHKQKDLWVGCFGAMSVIRYEYLVTINKLFPLSKLLDSITNRNNRKSFERILACLCQYVNAGHDISFHNNTNHYPIGAGFNKPICAYIGQLLYSGNLHHLRGAANRSEIKRCINIFNSMRCGTKESLFGNIFYYCRWGRNLADTRSYMRNDPRYVNLPLIKIWSGR